MSKHPFPPPKGSQNQGRHVRPPTMPSSNSSLHPLASGGTYSYLREQFGRSQASQRTSQSGQEHTAPNSSVGLYGYGSTTQAQPQYGAPGPYPNNPASYTGSYDQPVQGLQTGLPPYQDSSQDRRERPSRKRRKSPSPPDRQPQTYGEHHETGDSSFRQGHYTQNQQMTTSRGTTNEQYMMVPGTQEATHPYGDDREGPASFVDGKGKVTNVPGLLPYPKVETCSECKR